MKKITLLLSMVIGLALNAQIYYQLPVAQGNPGGLNADDEYPVGGGLSATWTTILGPSNSSPTWSSSQTIPFTFQFNSIAESSFKVSSTGILTFTTSATSVPGSTPSTLPNANIPDKSICVWGITGTGSSDNIATKVFGTAPNRQLWVFFSSYTMPGNANSWSYWSIVLEETTNNIYIVDQRNANGTLSATLGVQVNSTIGYQVSGSPNVGHLSANDPSAADNFYYSFLPGPQPQFDMAGVEITTADYLALAGAPFTISAEFLNLGTATITSADINYKINGGSTVTASLNNLNLASFASATLNHPTTWNPAVGAYSVEVWLSNLNGNADEKTGNDMVSKTITVVQNLTQRYNLFETFTSSTCPPCVPANTNMEQIFGNNPGEYVSLKYQMSWPGTGDPYYTLEGLTRRQYYGISAVPWMLIDGGWNQNGNSLTQGIFDQYQAIPAFVDLTANYSISGQTVSVDVEIDPLANVNSNNLRLFIAIKEKLTTQNVKTNGETEFHNVFKKFVTSDNGDPLSALTAGNTVNVSKSYTFNGSYVLPPNAGSPVDHATAHTVEEFSDLAVAVWIQDISTKEVLQAAEGNLVIGIDDFDAETHNLKVFPNPAKDVAFVSIDADRNTSVDLTVVNALGQVVLSQTSTVDSGTNLININTADFAAGVYAINVTVDGNTQTMKLTIQ